MTVTVFKIWVLQGGSEIIFPNLKNLSCVHKKCEVLPPPIPHTTYTPSSNLGYIMSIFCILLVYVICDIQSY